MQSNNALAARQDVRTFWTGPALSFYEILSLKSLLATGARVFVYTYERDLDVPAGVELADANEILSGPVHEFRHANGDTSLALHSNLFRYAALERFGGWYADLDIVCLTDKLPDADSYFAHMANDTINSAILKFPAHSAIMQKLIARSWQALPQASASTSVDARLSVGPLLFKQLIHEQGMEHLAQPRSKAYEIDIPEVTAFFDPSRCEETRARLANSDFTHLWNEEWRLLRIPKTYGPPKGSFLDLQFQRLDIAVPERARLEPRAIEAWVKERRLLTDIKWKLGVDTIGDGALARLAQSIQTFGWEAGGQVRHQELGAAVEGAPKPALARNPQTLRTFWHGDAIGPYQLLCLKSFADRGHRIEVFSYGLRMFVPEWIAVRDAAEILAEGEVLRPIAGGRGTAIHADLFRYAVLHRIGGWWIDPDVMLMKPELPERELFFAGRDAFGQFPLGVLKFPAGHILPAAALRETRALGDAYEQWERAGTGVLTALVEKGGLVEKDGLGCGAEPLGSVSWFGVLDLFDPSKSEALMGRIAEDRFLQLHDEVWRRAGIPQELAPPAGSLLDLLLARHDIGLRFPARMQFEHVRRWLLHMYRNVQLERASIVAL